MSCKSVPINNLRRPAKNVRERNRWQFNARIGKRPQAVECLVDIRRSGGAGSAIAVFDFEQRNTTTAHAARYDSFNCLQSNSPQLRNTRRRTIRAWWLIVANGEIRMQNESGVVKERTIAPVSVLLGGICLAVLI